MTVGNEKRLAEDFLISDLPHAIRRLRKQHKLTLRELGERCGLSISYLSDIERGRTQPSLDSVNAITGAMDYHVVMQFENSQHVFEMFGFLEVQVLYALEQKQFAKALSLIACLMEPGILDKDIDQS